MNTSPQDLSDVREFTSGLVALPCAPEVWRSSMGSLDVGIRQGIVEGGRWYEGKRLERRLLENVGALPAFLPEDNQIMPYRKFSVDFDVDVESMCLCLQSLLGVDFKAISAVLASPESAVGGWLRKADLAAGSEGGGWLRRTLTLARYKVESR